MELNVLHQAGSVPDLTIEAADVSPLLLPEGMVDVRFAASASEPLDVAVRLSMTREEATGLACQILATLAPQSDGYRGPASEQRLMFHFQPGDRVRVAATARSPRADQTGTVAWIEGDEELRYEDVVVRFDDGDQWILRSTDLLPESPGPWPARRSA